MEEGEGGITRPENYSIKSVTHHDEYVSLHISYKNLYEGKLLPPSSPHPFAIGLNYLLDYAQTEVTSTMDSCLPASEIPALIFLYTNSVSATISKNRTICYVTAVCTLESWVTLACVTRHAVALTRALVSACAIRESTAVSTPTRIAVALVESYTASPTCRKMENENDTQSA